MEPEDQSNIPTKPVIVPGVGEPSQGVTDSMVPGLLGAGRSSGGAWQPPSPEELQRDFPLYEIRGVLGRGGMGAVYRGWQKSLDRLVAIKILPPNLDDSIGGFTERFKREARAMAQLEHPGIVAVYDAGTTSGGLLYFVMQCVEGTDVQKLVKERGRLDPAEALRITGAVCDALGYAHDHGVIHRDIKPSNIMLDAHGHVKVADFGLAKTVNAETTMLTASNVTMGTPDFMAPEALRGAANADHRADLYAVGVMLYHMLTGELPRGRFVPPSRAVPGLDKRLDLIVDKALQPEPAARYSTATELRTALDPVTRSIAKRVATVTRASASRKRPLFIGIAVAVLAAIAALVHFAPWKNGASDRAAASTKSIVDVPKATRENPFVNTLGMKFVPVPGTQALFSIWDTRVADYAAYARVNKVADEWTKQQSREGVPVSREPEYPVVGVNWDDANAFCQWLTEKESADGKLPKGFKYRLPTDEEWSLAVGLAKEEGAAPAEKSGKNKVDYPWGIGFPPSKPKVGNYADEAFHAKFPPKEDAKEDRDKRLWIEGYTDGYATTSPVGSFPANAYGLYDMSGNVWQWCEDRYDASHTERVLRGASWTDYHRTLLLSSFRNLSGSTGRILINGFRCVLAPAAVSPSPAPQVSKSATPTSATKDKPFVNTLGMKFVPVPIVSGPTANQRVLFGVWDVRVQDYAVYAASAGAKKVVDSWTKMERDGVPAGRELNHPVVGVSWDDAQGFCQWLTEKENAEGKLPKGSKYRLPSDEEWSWAAGMPPELSGTPAEKSGKNSVDFPWGKDWPPTKKVGNYADETFHAKFPKDDKDKTKDQPWMKGHDDGYATTSPVGSFPANAYGLYDMGGNVWQWCEDWYAANHKEHVLRGASWVHYDRDHLLSSDRRYSVPANRAICDGFRCVLAPAAAPSRP